MTEKTFTEEKCKLIRRLGIILYETLLLISVLLFATIPVLFVTKGEAVSSEDVRFQLYCFSILLIYFIFPWCRSGQTLAMQTWRVILVQRDGSKITIKQAFIRFFVAIISWAVLGLGFIWSLIDKEKRTWHDILSGTKLVKLPKRNRKVA